MSDSSAHSPRSFSTTRWSLVVAAGRRNSPDADVALETLCGAYWFPLYAYVRSRGHNAYDARDLTQEFFTRLLEKDFLQSADPQRGRFRSFLLTVLKRFLSKEQGMTGLDLQVALRERGFEIPVIVISAYANVSNAVQAMHNGAITLLEKNCSSDELWKAIMDALVTDSERRAAYEANKSLIQRFEQLKPEELVVMQRVIEGQLNKVIAKDLSISPRTVETRRHNVQEKSACHPFLNLSEFTLSWSRYSDRNRSRT
jgi:RNA polymerase sigma factor (sigma-70 family)